MLFRALFIMLALATGTAANAEKFPSRTVTIVSPYQAGGTNDMIARVLAQKLSQHWRENVVVVNRPGANGAIGVTTVTHAVPDGYTLLAVASSALTLNPLFYRNLPYNVDRDLAPITRTGTVANVLVVKAKPRSLSYASQGVGSNGHVTGELFQAARRNRSSARPLQR